MPSSGHLPATGIKSMSLPSRALAGRFFTTSITQQALVSSELEEETWGWRTGEKADFQKGVLRKNRAFDVFASLTVNITPTRWPVISGVPEDFKLEIPCFHTEHLWRQHWFWPVIPRTPLYCPSQDGLALENWQQKWWYSPELLAVAMNSQTASFCPSLPSIQGHFGGHTCQMVRLQRDAPPASDFICARNRTVLHKPRFQELSAVALSISYSG